jgi:hypothetical protein
MSLISRTGSLRQDSTDPLLCSLEQERRSGKPSSLPTFEDLATEVATALRVGTYEPSVHRGPDVFLDRLELQGLDVRAQVIARLGDPSSTPNELHAAIIGLFTSAETLRVVTTNYDRHLTSAAEERFGVAPVVHRAPAVPLGRDFAGIVHLHGDLEGRSNDLILTSRDFGRAYLTDAWAARFLNELFQAYTTVFIGYSHQDVVMLYLAQGLRPGSRRFGSIDGAQNAELWRPLELNPVTYPYTADHAELTRAIEAWGDWARMGLLDHRSQVEVLAESSPPSTPRDTSYLEHIVAGDVTASYFAEYMSGTAWLDWITERLPRQRSGAVVVRCNPGVLGVAGPWLGRRRSARAGTHFISLQILHFGRPPLPDVRCSGLILLPAEHSL